MTINERRKLKQQEIINVMLQYKDEFGNIDLSRLRKENDKVYNRISYYFGSIDNALIACGSGSQATKDDNIVQKAAKGAPINRKILRNELAYDMLVELRKKHTLEEIATRYGCTRAHVNQLFQSLAKSVEAANDIQQNENQSMD